MKLVVLGAVAALIATPLGAEPVSSAWGDWREVPTIIKKGDLRVSSQTVDRIAAASADGKCPQVGDEKHLRLSMPFLMEFSPRGQIQQVVVWKMNCPEIESLVGGMLLEMARAGEYRPTGENQLGWYRGEFKLTSQ